MIVRNVRKELISLVKLLTRDAPATFGGCKIVILVIYSLPTNDINETREILSESRPTGGYK